MKELVEEPILKWKKTGGGSLRLAGRKQSIIKPGQVFEAKRSELPKAFMDTIVCLSEEKEKEFKTAIISKEVGKAAENSVYVLEPIEDKPSFFNVVHKDTKKAVNEKPLREKKALELISTLEG